MASALIAQGRQPALALGGIVLQISFLLDCVDGQLSRFRDSSSLFGAILDHLCDRVKLFSVVLGLAYGLYRVTQDRNPLFLGFGYFVCEYTWTSTP